VATGRTAPWINIKPRANFKNQYVCDLDACGEPWVIEPVQQDRRIMRGNGY
jgi:hypothetical protein